MPRKNDLEGEQDQGGKHGGQKGMPKPEPRPTTRREPGREGAPDDEMSLAIPRVAIHYERREAAPIGRRADWIVVAFAPSIAVGGTPRANPCEATGLCPGAANVGRARHRYRNQNSTRQQIPN